MNTPALVARRRASRALLSIALALAASSAFAANVTASSPDSTASIASLDNESMLKPGTFEWAADAESGTGPVTIVVSLPAQMVHVYRGDTRIARSTISSGRPGYDTPPGVYEILEKDRVHHSNKYDNAPMPYMQRLTWDGVALHAGHIPGYPASHGCVRLPMAFAEQLFKITEKGGRVIVADESNFSEAVLYPGARVPVDPWTGLERGAETTADVATVNNEVSTPAVSTEAGVTTSVTTATAPDTANAPALAGN
ncbi:L,D-transpeptidase family protein [Cognatilysobacter terrigena]|uniref:L,D-transpeptidase family protein n=1 Tax=Cognatilysobacter terrigena TaxID=2488749 RepID=UPI00105B4702|nr:L,D-transpeptidase family protein [Lysobacter terrigena]